eukprot:g4041.t1
MRRLDEEPLPEILVEEPQRKDLDKRVRPDASAAALRLVDTVGSRQWPDEDYGLPASWLHAAANASWPAMEGRLEKLPSLPALQEASRRLIEGSDGGAMLIDVERSGENTESLGVEAPTAFTINGVAMVATPEKSSDFVWDVYAISDSVTSSLSAAVRLQDTLDHDAEDALESMSDIDDSSEEGRDQSSDEEGEEDVPNWTNELDYREGLFSFLLADRFDPRRPRWQPNSGTMANMDALRKAGAGAMPGAVSALGQRAASLKSSLDGSTFHLHPQAPQGESHNHSQREAAELAEVAALQERLKAVMEDRIVDKPLCFLCLHRCKSIMMPYGPTQDLSAARQDAMLAQREATAAADPRADRGGVASPPVEDCCSDTEPGLAPEGSAAAERLGKSARSSRPSAGSNCPLDGEGRSAYCTSLRFATARSGTEVATEKAGKPSAAALPALEEQLRSAEGKLDHLGQRLQSSQGTSRLTYELRCNMESVLDRVRQRDQAIEQLLTRQERMEHASVLRRERLSYAQDTAELGWEAAVAASPTSSCQSDAGELHVLEQELQALQSAMKELQLQNADRAEGLRAQIREHQRKLDEPEPEKQIEEESRNGQTNQEEPLQALQVSQACCFGKRDYYDPFVDSQESFDSILYVQKIKELERQNAGLEQDLELLKSSEQCLQADSKEKEELISFLMRTRDGRNGAAPRPRAGAGARLFGMLRRDRMLKSILGHQ